MFAEYGLKPLWDIMTGVSTAQTSLGLESVLFGGVQHQDYTSAEKTKERNVKIQASTVGMSDMVMDALQIGSTTSPNAPEMFQPPCTIEEMQTLLNKIVASSEDAIIRAVLRRHRSLSDAVLDAVCDICPSPEGASRVFRKRALSLIERDGKEDGNVEEFDRIRDAVQQCEQTKQDETSGEMGTTTPTVAHCCKFISTDRAHINDPELFSYLDLSSDSTCQGVTW